MRGRKHPLEVFRENGREFRTRGDVSSPPAEEAARARPEEGAPRRGAGRRSLRPPAPRAPAADESSVAPPERRRWDVRAPRFAERLASAAQARRALSMPLARAATLLAGLVLVVGAAYALALWPFAPGDGDGEPRSPLRRIQSIWRDPLAAREGGTAAREPDEGSASVESSAQEGGPPSVRRTDPDVTWWVVAASTKLPADAKRDDALLKRFRPDKERLTKALGSELAGMTIQTCYGSRSRDDALLRVGPASAADDPALLRVLAKVRDLKGSFKDANIRAFRTQ